MFGAKRTNGWREDRGVERSRLERMLERNDEPLIADLFGGIRCNLDLVPDSLLVDRFLVRNEKYLARPDSRSVFCLALPVIAARQAQDVAQTS